MERNLRLKEELEPCRAPSGGTGREVKSPVGALLLVPCQALPGHASPEQAYNPKDSDVPPHTQDSTMPTTTTSRFTCAPPLPQVLGDFRECDFSRGDYRVIPMAA